MSHTIIELWNGNVAPCEHCGAHDMQANHLCDLMERNCQALCDGLTNAQIEVLKKYMDASENYLFRMMELAFHEGFCLGARLEMEVLM